MTKSVAKPTPKAIRPLRKMRRRFESRGEGLAPELDRVVFGGYDAAFDSSWGREVYAELDIQSDGCGLRGFAAIMFNA